MRQQPRAFVLGVERGYGSEPPAFRADTIVVSVGVSDSRITYVEPSVFLHYAVLLTPTNVFITVIFSEIMVMITILCIIVPAPEYQSHLWWFRGYMHSCNQYSTYGNM